MAAAGKHDYYTDVNPLLINLCSLDTIAMSFQDPQQHSNVCDQLYKPFADRDPTEQAAASDWRANEDAFLVRHTGNVQRDYAQLLMEAVNRHVGTAWFQER